MTTCSKLYSDIPFAHRQHNHKGHCALIHGHNWAFEFTFGCDKLDECGFVVDFGKLKWLGHWLNERFDHKLVLDENDPALPYIKNALLQFASVTVVPNCGAEGLAVYLFEIIDRLLASEYDNRVRLVSVKIYEDSKNTATFHA